MVQNILQRNKILFWLGSVHFVIFTLLFGYSFLNETLILGINSMIKPMKFALSIWIFSWTMALILHYVEDVQKVINYSWAAVIAFSFEQLAITVQAFRGELSHFNKTTPFNSIVYSLMGVFIVGITLWMAHISYVFSKQKTYKLSPVLVLGIKIGLIYCVIFSLFGGYVSSLEGHTVGAKDGGEGVLFLNWSITFGDLRVAHFFGIHSLQIIPLFAILVEKKLKRSNAIKAVWLFSLVYLAFLGFTLMQGLSGIPFIHF